MTEQDKMMTLVSIATLKKKKITMFLRTHFFLSPYGFHVFAASLLSNPIQLYYCSFVLVPTEE